EENAMLKTRKLSRREFIVSSAAVAGGLALGFNVPFGPNVVRAADGSPEVNAWVVIRPDDTVVVRIARSEMGQGTLTGLAQMVDSIDLKLPGMLNAAIRDCPVFGGKVASFDASKAESMPGVTKVVRVGDSAIAVIADTWWHAKNAIQAININWDGGDNAKVSS